ncbi:MAG: adenosylcobinamide-GDP ribazoletransferase [Aestuariivita sp.]|nr:adenosylcobinamide-GDP ribazoletransferase [Aestuariivita sp.]MCY4345761.1 adenosylcobinamide-GDP ribazoletransferase [Aestuariivita sp.]
MIRQDLIYSIMLLTRLPIPQQLQDSQDRKAQSVWAFPIVGLLVGGLAALLASLTLALGIPVEIVAGFVLAVQIIITGAMHEDGLADTADGFWGGYDRETRLLIMADSKIGAFGIIAIVLAIGLRWAALVIILNESVWPILAVAALSRSGLPALMTFLPNVRVGGLSASLGKPSIAVTVLAAILGFLSASLTVGVYSIYLAAITTASLSIVAAIANHKIGGQTGDVLGAGQQVSEIVCLVVVAAYLI